MEGSPAAAAVAEAASEVVALITALYTDPARAGECSRLLEAFQGAPERAWPVAVALLLRWNPRGLADPAAGAAGGAGSVPSPAILPLVQFFAAHTLAAITQAEKIPTSAGGVDALTALFARLLTAYSGEAELPVCRQLILCVTTLCLFAVRGPAAEFMAAFDEEGGQEYTPEQLAQAAAALQKITETSLRPWLPTSAGAARENGAIFIELFAALAGAEQSRRLALVSHDRRALAFALLQQMPTFVEWTCRIVEGEVPGGGASGTGGTANSRLLLRACNCIYAWCDARNQFAALSPGSRGGPALPLAPLGSHAAALCRVLFRALGAALADPAAKNEQIDRALQLRKNCPVLVDDDVPGAAAAGAGALARAAERALLELAALAHRQIVFSCSDGSGLDGPDGAAAVAIATAFLAHLREQIDPFCPPGSAAGGGGGEVRNLWPAPSSTESLPWRSIPYLAARTLCGLLVKMADLFLPNYYLCHALAAAGRQWRSEQYGGFFAQRAAYFDCAAIDPRPGRALAESARIFASSLLQHPVIEVREAAADFWLRLLPSYDVQATAEVAVRNGCRGYRRTVEDSVDEQVILLNLGEYGSGEAAGSGAEGDGAGHFAATPAFGGAAPGGAAPGGDNLLVQFRRAVPDVMAAIAWPSRVDFPLETFPFSCWMRFRDSVASQLVVLVDGFLGLDPLVELVRSCVAPGQPWQRMELGLLLVAALAPRLPAIDAPDGDTSVEVFDGSDGGGGGESLLMEEGFDDGVPRAPQYTLFITDILDLILSPDFHNRPAEASGAESLRTLSLQIAAAQVVLWTSGFIGRHRQYFPRAFEALRAQIYSLLQSPLFASQGLGREGDDAGDGGDDGADRSESQLPALLTEAERTSVTAISTLVPAASGILCASLAEGYGVGGGGFEEAFSDADLRRVLGSMSELALLERAKGQLSVGSRVTLIVSAGAVIQDFPILKMQRFHYELVKGFYEAAAAAYGREEGGEGRPRRRALSSRTTDLLRFFFTALQSVEVPQMRVPAPPPSPNAMLLAKSDEARHPVLNVLEEFWDLVERVVRENPAAEAITDPAAQAVVRIFAAAPSHAPRYMMFAQFLKLIVDAFDASLSIFHLSPLRALLGPFGSGSGRVIVQRLTAALVSCTDRVLREMLQTPSPAAFIEANPDVVGMSFDCNNAALDNADSAEALLACAAFHRVLALSIDLAPSVMHPKVLMTLLLVVEKFLYWLGAAEADEIAAAATAARRDGGAWGGPHAAAATPGGALATLKNLAQQIVREGQLFSRIITAAMATVTNIFDGNSQWLGIVAQLLLNLRHCGEPAERFTAAVREALASAPRAALPAPVAAHFAAEVGQRLAAGRLSPLTETLRRLAEAAEVAWQRAQAPKADAGAGDAGRKDPQTAVARPPLRSLKPLGPDAAEKLAPKERILYPQGGGAAGLQPEPTARTNTTVST